MRAVSLFAGWLADNVLPKSTSNCAFSENDDDYPYCESAIPILFLLVGLVLGAVAVIAIFCLPTVPRTKLSTDEEVGCSEATQQRESEIQIIEQLMSVSGSVQRWDLEETLFSRRKERVQVRSASFSLGYLSDILDERQCGIRDTF